MSEKEQIKAVGMFSGGLDSTLATCLMLDQGIEVTAIHFRTGFSYELRRRVTATDSVEPTIAEQAADQLGIDLTTVDVSSDFIPVVLNPHHGYGSGMNPCMDCRIFLLRQAKAWMEAHDHHFVFTGEVVGQRPKSQKRPMLDVVEQESGLEGLLLRPLSAKLLSPTVPEERGWVDREQLYDISGRSRTRQIALAERFGITDYAQPSGGCCFLIDQHYAERLRDFLAHEGEDALTAERALLLSIGRQIRLPSGRKVIVGRNEGENKYITSRSDEGVLLTTVDYPGPTTLVWGDPTQAEIELAARITARYSQGRDEPILHVTVRRSSVREGMSEVVAVSPLALEEIHALMV